jgi:hypothetical protein
MGDLTIYSPMKLLVSHKEPEVCKLAYRLTMEIFEITKSFPKEKRYSLTDLIRRSSRSVPAKIAEAFRKRRYETSHDSKLSHRAMIIFMATSM